MKRRGNRCPIHYHIALNKENNDINLSTSHKSAAKFVGIHPLTLARHLKLSDVYNTDQFTIWHDVPLEKIRRGFILRRR
jgi:hypothetical protein